MKKTINVVIYFLKSKISLKKRAQLGFDAYCNTLTRYAGKKVLSTQDVNDVIFDLINNKQPFCVARYGATELFCSSCFEFDIKMKKNKAIKQLGEWSGFFPTNINYGEKFNSLIRKSSGFVDVLGIWALRFEEYYIKHYLPLDSKITALFSLEPWRNAKNPWSAALKDKKVLVIHPFENTINEQYKKRLEIFPGTNILPEFELKTLKAVQTIAGEKDERFETWFDALEWMYEEALKIDFDVAIIGCGAYGLPLAAKLKEAGKQAIHLGGATQILFGIRGKRWDEDENQKEVRKWYNDAWVYPSEKDVPRNAKSVEGGCYWR